MTTRESHKRAPLARILKAHGIRRVEVAAAAGVGTNTVHRLCRGQYQGLKLVTLCRVARAVGVPPTEVVPFLASQPTALGLIGTRRRLHPRQGLK